jgi:hypothetical protein
LARCVPLSALLLGDLCLNSVVKEDSHVIECWLARLGDYRAATNGLYRRALPFAWNAKLLLTVQE